MTMESLPVPPVIVAELPVTVEVKAGATRVTPVTNVAVDPSEDRRLGLGQVAGWGVADSRSQGTDARGSGINSALRESN